MHSSIHSTLIEGVYMIYARRTHGADAWTVLYSTLHILSRRYIATAHVYTYVYIWVTSRRRGNEPGGLDAHVPFFRIKLPMHIYINIWYICGKRERDIVYSGEWSALYVCTCCQPVTRYTVGRSVLCEHTRARICIYLLTKKKKGHCPLLPPRHVHAQNSHHGLPSFVGPSRRPERHETSHGIYTNTLHYTTYTTSKYFM